MLNPRRALRCVRYALVGLVLAACGSSDESRPIEVLFYVDGLSGTRFMVDGLQAASSDREQPGVLHQLPGRTFEVPYFFVMENAFQFKAPQDGIRGCFRTLPDETATITIFLFYGTTLQQRVTLQPGQCFGPGYGPDNPPDCADFVCGVTPAATNSPEIRFEVCNSPDTGTCMDAPAAGPANVGFTASIGDFNATNSTSCAIPEAATSFCTTPSIFYLEDPVDRLQGIFTKLRAQNPDAELQADLYVDGELRDTKKSSGDVILDLQL